MSEPLTAGEALHRSTFTEYRKTALTPISDITYPPGTVFQTPEGLRAEDEDTRAAFDVQGGIYPIRESVFRASYGATPTPDTLLLALWRVAEAARAHTDAECSCLAVNWTHDDDCALVTTEAALRKALAALATTREEMP